MPTINKRFLFKLFLVLFVCIGAIFGVHAVQSRRIPAALKLQSERAADMGGEANLVAAAAEIDALAAPQLGAGVEQRFGCPPLGLWFHVFLSAFARTRLRQCEHDAPTARKVASAARRG